MVRSNSGDVDSSINIGYKNLIAGRNIGNGVLFGCGEESWQKKHPMPDGTEGAGML